METDVNTSEKKKLKGLNINKPAYAIMLFIGVIFLALKDWSTASIMVSLALVFDPFDITVTWTKRPIWQRIWLILHLILSLSLLTYSFIAK